jgi:hypothetical protein
MGLMLFALLGDPSTAFAKDLDGDRVNDRKDNCPGVFNPPATRKGPQPDWNDNGVGDACDDSDADGVVDSDDNCLETPNPLQEDWNGNGVGDACDFPWSSYEKPVDLPDCDPNDLQVKMIKENLDWKWDNPSGEPRYDYITNNPAYRVFCVHPGDYSAAGRIRTKSTSGADGSPRVIRHYDPTGASPAHPVDQSPEQRAVLFSFLFAVSDYWVIDGITIEGAMGPMTEDGPYDGWPKGETLFEPLISGSHNIVNRLLVQDTEEGLTIVLNPPHLSDHNTVQNSVFRRILTGPHQDDVAIGIRATDPNMVFTGNHIVNNEMYDVNQGFQAILAPAAVSVDGDRWATFPGTVIENNDTYATRAMYSDCEGERDPNGACACAEAGIVAKAGGTTGAPEDLLLINNNRLWGWRLTDDSPDPNGVPKVGCGGSGSNGSAINVHGKTAYALVTNNIIWDSQQGIHAGGGEGNSSYIGNIIHGAGWANDTRDAQRTALSLFIGSGQEMYRNTIIDSFSWGGAHSTDGDEMDVVCNVIIDSPGRISLGPVAGNQGIEGDYNAYYGPGIKRLERPGDFDVVMPTAADAQHQEYCFLTKMWTGPEVVCLPNAKPTAASPHPAFCDGLIGYRPDVGINNDLIP